MKRKNKVFAKTKKFQSQAKANKKDLSLIKAMKK